jgi:hypothetical protein
MNKLLKFVMILTVTGLFFSCSDMMDVHQKYLEGGEKIYAPRVAMFVVHDGKGRAQLQFWLLESPNVRSVDVFWNDHADSLIVPVTPSTGLDSMKVYVPLTEERSYMMYIRTTDIFGNHSLSEMASATSYGAIYESMLSNRSIKKAITSGSVTEIQWYGTADDYVRSEVRYTDVNGEERIVRVLPNETSTLCPDVKPGSAYAHRSLYVPANSIDTFYLEWTPIRPPIKFDKSSWSVIAWSDEDAADGGGAVTLINNNLSDYWHSAYRPAAPLPHWAIIDMGAPKELVTVDTYRRPGNTNTRTVQYYVSDDPDPDAVTWTKIAEGTFASGNLMTVTATVSVRGQYLKIYLPNTNATGGNTYTSVAEVDVYGYE